MADTAHRGAEPATISFQPTGRPWTVILPPVYRYLDAQYIDLFFESGELRLSSFRQFAKHSDEARKDEKEGKAFVNMEGAGGQFFSMVGGGNQSYVLCGSTILSREIMQDFKADAAFEITNVPDFALAVAWRLDGFMSGQSGHCIYAGERMLLRHVDDDPRPSPADGAEEISVDQLLVASQQAARGENMFLKEARHARQAEYRMLWNMIDETEDYVTVRVPEARQFCRKITADELT